MPTAPAPTSGVPVMTSASETQPRRRYARSTRSIQVGVHLWPDVMDLIRKHADEHNLTPSGAVHDCLRRYFQLPSIN